MNETPTKDQYEEITVKPPPFTEDTPIPFTGLDVTIVLLVAVALVTLGLVLRRLARVER